jgi:hypothetical protein
MNSSEGLHLIFNDYAICSTKNHKTTLKTGLYLLNGSEKFTSGILYHIPDWQVFDRFILVKCRFFYCRKTNLCNSITNY